MSNEFHSKWLDWKPRSQNGVSGVSSSTIHMPGNSEESIRKKEDLKDMPRAILTAKTPDTPTQRTDSTDSTRILNGHIVEEVIIETERMIIFRDPDGRLWRRVHSWGMTWPLEVRG